MRRLLAWLCGIVMFVTVPMTALASQSSQVNMSWKYTIVDCGSSSFVIQETIDSYHCEIKKYEAETPSVRTIEETKALLLELGMEQETIDSLSDETLEIYAESPQIFSTVSYTKTDEDGNVSYLDKATAMAESNQVNEIYKENFLQGISPNETKSFQDSYMRIVYIVSYRGNGVYLFSTDAKWLTMPFFRGKDSIGSCAMNCTVTPDTRSGNYSYTITQYANGVTQPSTASVNYSDDISSSNFKNAINGNWYGSAAIMDLPNDIKPTDGKNVILHTNYRAHYQYQGHISQPSIETYFNTVATYSHATIRLGIGNPSVSVNLSTGNVSASIGLKIWGDTDDRSVEMEMHYVP